VRNRDREPRRPQVGGDRRATSLRRGQEGSENQLLKTPSSRKKGWQAGRWGRCVAGRQRGASPAQATSAKVRAEQ